MRSQSNEISLSLLLSLFLISLSLLCTLPFKVQSPDQKPSNHLGAGFPGSQVTYMTYTLTYRL